jgi:hypothetical protein
MSNRRKWTKLPVTIEAEPWWPDDHPYKPTNALPESEFPEVTRWEEKPAYGWIITLEGGHIVTPGDWIITGVKGEQYPCKPDIFSATYSAAYPSR